MAKNLGKENVCFILQFSYHTLSLEEVRSETQGRNMETETEAETMNKYMVSYWLAPPGFVSLLSYSTFPSSKMMLSCVKLTLS